MGELANAAVGTPDTQYKSSPQLIYGFAEQSVVIIMGCIPTLHAVKKSDFSKLNFLKRYYEYVKKSSTSDYTSEGYTDLGKGSHKLDHLHATEGITKASGGAGESLSPSRNHCESNDRLPGLGQITRTDRYTVTYDSEERMPRETV